MSDHSLQKRGQKQRRILLIGALWGLTWSVLMANDLILYTNWKPGISSSAILNLIVSPFALALFVLPIALFGRLLGNLSKLRPYRYLLVLGLPSLLGVALLVPTTLDRLQPQRRFEASTGVTFPKGGHVTAYNSTRWGIDSSFKVEFKASEAELIQLLRDLNCIDEDDQPDQSRRLTPDKYNIAEAADQVVISITIDWPSSTAIFEYVNY